MRFATTRRLASLAGFGLLALGATSGAGMAAPPTQQEREPISFDLVVPERPFAFLPAALADAAGTATVSPGDSVDELALELTGLPAGAEYNVFLTESGAPPFGAIQYLADLTSDDAGEAEVVVATAVLDAFALRGIASEGALDPEATGETRVALDHIVVWPKEPETTAALFEEQGQDMITTPFDDDAEAGPAVLTTAVEAGAGPLAAEAAASAGYDRAAASIVVARSPELGAFLTDRAGMTLYRFANDGPNQSTCEGECAANWPAFSPDGEPALALGLPGTLATIVGADGGEQVTYDGMPLYYFAGDEAPGDVNGQGVNDVWSVVEPAA